MSVPLAHGGHWAVQLLYLAPMVPVLVILWRGRKDRHPGPADGDAYQPEEPPGDDIADNR